MLRRAVAGLLHCSLALALGCAGDPAREPGPTTAASTTAATTADPTSGVQDDDAAADTDGATSAGTVADDTASGPEFPCESVAECRLYGDCCTCVALHRDAPPPPECPADCDRDACSVWGISELLCGHGCLIKLVECDPAMVECTDAPPTCEDGFVPSLLDRCWSGHCVPMQLCRP